MGTEQKTQDEDSGKLAEINKEQPISKKNRGKSRSSGPKSSELSEVNRDTSEGSNSDR